MGYIQEGVMRKWKDGDTVTAYSLEQEIKIIVAAINDNYQRIVSQAPADYYTSYNRILTHMDDTKLHRSWGNYKVGGDGENDLRAYEKNILTSYNDTSGNKVVLNPNNNFTNGIEVKGKFSFVDEPPSQPKLPYYSAERSYSLMNASALDQPMTYNQIQTIQGGMAISNHYIIIPRTGLYLINAGATIAPVVGEYHLNLKVDRCSSNGTVLRSYPRVTGRTSSSSSVGIQFSHAIYLNKDDKIQVLINHNVPSSQYMGGLLDITFIG